jgi:flavin reductase (DIM6/NTAB) family NADH-FMN oxidoreductase RutF
MDPEKKRIVLRNFTYGVYVLTVKSGDEVAAATVTWVSQSSLNPSKIMAGLRRGSKTAAYVLKEKKFALNIVGESQKDIAAAFLKHAKAEGQKINGYPYKTEQTGAPILIDVPYYLECEIDAVLEGSDHDVITAEVINAGVNSDEHPLILKSTGWKYGG